MRSARPWKYAGGILFLLAVTVFILMVFYALSHTNNRDISLNDTANKKNGWHYEILVNGNVQEYEPVFSDEFVPSFPEGIQAVRISRVLTEDIPFAQIEWGSLYNGVEIFLEDELLYTDFHGTERTGGGFLSSVREELERIYRERETDFSGRNVCMSLPADYVGKTLIITTYFSEQSEYFIPAYPILGNEDSKFSMILVEETPIMAMLTVYALFALFIAAVYLMDISSNRSDWHILLLSLYFVLLFLTRSLNSSPAYYGILSGYVVDDFVVQNYVEILYLAPLFLYLALRLTHWRKPALCLCTAVWFLYELFMTISNLHSGQFLMTGRSGVSAFLLLGAFGAAYIMEAFLHKKQLMAYPHKGRWAAGIAAIIVLCSLNLARTAATDTQVISETGSMLGTLFSSIAMGDFLPIVSFLADIISVSAMVIMVTGVIRRALNVNAEIVILKERSRLTLESYNRLVEANKFTNSARHEMRHHMTALSGILESGDIQRARRYITSVTSEMDQMPEGRYSHNLLVNVIAGTYLNQAKAEGIQVDARLNVPPELPMADEDLSVFLSNMLQNALEACRRMDKEKDRSIIVQMRLRNNFLFIKCVNSTDDRKDHSEKADTETPGNEHGHGLVAMERIAEKYGSMLIIERMPDSFSVKSNLCLASNTEKAATH